VAADPVRLFGRPSKARLAELTEQAQDARDELAAHCKEALDFVDAAWPHLSALERMAIELGPEALRHSRILAGLLASYERRHLPEDDTPMAVAA
jgi:hypothetical protein